MSGTQPVGVFIPPNYPGQSSGTAYPLNIDADWSVAQRIVDSFAPRALPTPAMAFTIDPGHLFTGSSLSEIGAFTAGTLTQYTNAITVTGPAAGIAANQSVIGFLYESGVLQYAYPIGGAPNGTAIVETASGSAVTTWNDAIIGGTGIGLIFGQPIGNVSANAGAVTNGSPIISGLWSTAGMFVGMQVTIGVTGLPAGTVITSIDSATQIHVSNSFTGTTTSPTAVTTTIPAPTSHPRIDRVVINRATGAVQWLAGTESASPVPPAIPLGYAPCCQVSLATTTTAITNTANLTDERDLAALGLPADPYQYAQPASGASITITNGVKTLILDPSATLATLTVTLPSAPGDGQRVGLTATQPVTALTLNPNTGQSLAANAALTSLSPPFNGDWWIYRAASATWYRGG